MTWETVSLGDLVRPVSGRAGSEELPVYSVTKHAGFVPSREYFKKQVFSSDLTTYKVVDAGQFAYATIHLDEGSIGIAPERCVISPMYTVFSVDPVRVHAPYLLRYLKSPTGLAEYPRLGRGTAERRKSIGLDALGRIRLVIPPLAEQRRIAAILDEADVLRAANSDRERRLRASTESALATLLTATSTDSLLGDLVIRIDSGSSPICEPRAAGNGEWGVLKLGAVTTGTFKPQENKAVTPGYVPNSNHEVRPGDLLLSRKNTLEHVGASVYVESTPDRLLLPDLVFRLVLRDPRLTRVLQAFLTLSSTRANLSSLAGGSASSMANISKERLRTIKVPNWAPSTIEAATRILESTGTMLGLIARSASGHDDLFASLQYRAFRGEL